MSDKPTDIDKSLGELRVAWNAMFRRLAELEERVKRLEDPQTEDEQIMVTLPERWFA